MNAILMAINQKWCDLILSGRKSVEVRKRIPTRFEAPFRVYLYRTRGEDRSRHPGMVVGEFICDKVYGLEREKQTGYDPNWNGTTCSEQYGSDQHLSGKGNHDAGSTCPNRNGWNGNEQNHSGKGNLGNGGADAIRSDPTCSETDNHGVDADGYTPPRSGQVYYYPSDQGGNDAHLARWVWVDGDKRTDLIRERDLNTCLTGDELKRYLGNGKRLYGLHVSGQKRYDTPLTLEEVMRCRHLDRDGVCGAFMRVERSSTGTATLKRMNPPCPYQYVDYFNPTYLPHQCQCRKVVNVTPPQSWQYVEDEDVQAARIRRECERQQNSNQKPVSDPSKIAFSEKEGM